MENPTVQQISEHDYETDTDISETEYQGVTEDLPSHWDTMSKLVTELQSEVKQIKLEESGLAAACDKYKFVAEKSQRSEEKVRIKNKKLVSLLKEKELQKNLIQSEVNELKDQQNSLRSELEKANQEQGSLAEENRAIKQEIDELKIQNKTSTVVIKNLNEKLENQSKNHAEELISLEDEIQNLSSQNKSIKNRLDEKEAELETKERKLEAVTTSSG